MALKRSLKLEFYLRLIVTATISEKAGADSNLIQSKLLPNTLCHFTSF